MIKSSLVLLVMLQRLEGENSCVYTLLNNCVVLVSSLLPFQVTLTALEEMFQGARSIMNWLGDCAKVCYSAPYTD